MKQTLIRTSIAVLNAAAVAAYGAGYSLHQGSAAGNADAASATAKGGEPGAIFFNPATITDLPGTQVEAGATFVAPKGSVETTNPYTGEHTRTKGKEKLWTIPHAYMTHQINEELWFGFGMYTRFGLGSELPNDWPGRYNSYKATFETFSFNPNLAWRVNDHVSLSAGFTLMMFNIELKQKIDAAGLMGVRNYNDPSPSPYDVDQQLDGDGYGFGIDLGIRLKPVDKLTIGAAYHSRIKQQCEGDATWVKPAAVQALAPGFFGNTSLKSTVTLPDLLMFAVTYDVTDALTVGFGVTHTLWSTYDTLQISLGDDMLPGKDKFVSKKDWDNCWRYTLGATYTLSEAVTLRASYTFDDSPLKDGTVDYMVPADDRHLFIVGVGWTVGDWTFDASYMYELIDNLSIDARVENGVYDSKFCNGSAHAVGLSVTKRF